MFKYIKKFFFKEKHEHIWSQWSKPYKKVKNSLYNYQARQCTTCGLIQERVL